MKNPELPVIQRSYDLLLWTTNHTGKFPRSHRFSIGDRLERQHYAVLEDLLKAKFTKDRAAILEEANMALEILRFQFRLARDLKCLPLNSYGFAAGEIEEIGKMIGGWLKVRRTRQ